MVKARQLAKLVRSSFKVDRNYAVTVAVLAVVYVAAAKLGLSLAFTSKQVSAAEKEVEPLKMDNPFVASAAR